MSIFKKDREIKRMIFNIYADNAERLDRLKDDAKQFDKRLDVDTAVNKALEKFIAKAEKKMEEMRREGKGKRAKPGVSAPDAAPEATNIGNGTGDDESCTQ